RDVVAIHLREANGMTGVHILDGSTGYSTIKREYYTALPAVTNDQWAFTLGHINANGLPDVVAINNAEADSHTGVHVLDGTNYYRSFKLETSTSLPSVSANQWKFVSGSDNANTGYADVIAINLWDGNHTSVHVLDGSRSYHTMKAEAVTTLPALNPVEWAFASQYTSATGQLVDVYAIHLDESASSTGVHVVTSASRYAAMGTEAYSALPGTTNQQFQFGSDPYNSVSH
nr:hypothetical protein [Actinomycetota bacterium]